LIETVDFKKIDKEDLKKIYSKKKWLQKNQYFLNQIIIKDFSGSDKSDGSDKSEEEEGEEGEESDDGGSSAKNWDPKNSHASYYTFDKKKKIATYSYTGNYWAATLVSKQTKKYSIKLGNQCGYFMFGMAETSKLNKNSCNYSTNGYYFYPNGNCLYGIGKTNNIPNGCDTNSGTIYGVFHNRSKGDIIFYKNGKQISVAFQGIKKLKLCGVVDAYYNSSSYELINGKYKK